MNNLVERNYYKFRSQEDDNTYLQMNVYTYDRNKLAYVFDRGTLTRLPDLVRTRIDKYNLSSKLTSPVFGSLEVLSEEEYTAIKGRYRIKL